jgi:hypothetical protein
MVKGLLKLLTDVSEMLLIFMRYFPVATDDGTVHV